MNIDDRQEGRQLCKNLMRWASVARKARKKYALAVRELSLILSTKQVLAKSSLENKTIQAIQNELDPDQKDVLKNLLDDLISGEQQYKSAELIWKSIEHKINWLKYENKGEQ